MREISMIIDAEYDGKSVLDVLIKKCGFSKNAVKNLKFNGEILVGGKPVTVRRELTAGEELKLKIPEKTSENIKPVAMPLDIIFEDEYILAVNKPCGMPTHPSAGNYENTLANGVMAYYSAEFVFRAITRLDKYTSGVVLIAKTAVSAAKLSSIMKNGGFKKTYMAVLSGIASEKSGEITAPIGRCEDSIIKRKITPDGKPACTRYEIIAEKDGKSLAKVNIKTGRTHQIRLHMAHIGTPVYGDFLYGEELEGVRICLHCRSLEFIHPFSGELLKLSCDMPNDMKTHIF